jgi:hypothetical protein
MGLLLNKAIHGPKRTKLRSNNMRVGKVPNEKQLLNQPAEDGAAFPSPYGMNNLILILYLPHVVPNIKGLVLPRPCSPSLTSVCYPEVPDKAFDRVGLLMVFAFGFAHSIGLAQFLL